jgi:tetratricopeptide (TPR) repeat protein
MPDLTSTKPSPDSDQFDFFVSYARNDNASGWITRFLDELKAEHEKFAPGRPLKPFFDRDDIRSLDDWRHRIFNEGLAKSRLFVAFISPNYFASEWCRREWKAWIDTEIAKHILSAGAAPIYFVEVPGFVGKVAGLSEQQMLGEEEVARHVAELCGLPAPHDSFVAAASPIVRQMRDRRQITSDFVKPLSEEGIQALRREDLRRVLAALARDLDERAEQVHKAAESQTTAPPYNKKFSGRLEELLSLRERLKDDRAGVVCGVHGLGGIGKTELAFTYAHAFAGAYPGGRFLIPCEGKASLRDASLVLGDLFRDRISDQERMTPDSHFAAILNCLRERLGRLGHILLVLDNVTALDLLAAQQTDQLTALGPKLHLLATTRLAPPSGESGTWLTLGELPDADALDLLEKHRPFDSEEERVAALRIVKQLGGFTLAVELVAAWLAVHKQSSSYQRTADTLGLEDLEEIAGEGNFELRRHNHERRLSAVLGPVLTGLEPAERRALEYAALLPPDCLPLPWLKSLVAREFAELAESSGRSDPWIELCERLIRLALFTPLEEEDGQLRLVRVHRLVQQLVLRDCPEPERAAHQHAVDALIMERDDDLETTTVWTPARWELEPLTALGDLWDLTNHPGAVSLLNQAGRRWMMLAEWGQAEPVQRRVIAIAERILGPDHSSVATCINNLAQLLQDTNRLAEAEPLMRRALAIAQRSHGPDHPDLAMYLNNLAALLQDTNRLAEAEPLMRRALAIAERSHGPDHPDLAMYLNNLAGLLQETNRLTEAESLYRLALAINERSLGLDHPAVATALHNLAQFLQATNRLVEAEPLMRRALAIDERSYGPDHPYVAADLTNLGEVLHATNRLLAAEPLMRRALTIDERSYGPDHPSVAIRLNNLAALLQDTKRLAEAELLMHRALAICEQSYGRDHPMVATALNNLSQLLQATNRLAEAEPLMRRHLEIFLDFTRATGHRHPHLRAAINNYAGLLGAMGRSSTQILATMREMAPEFF